MNLYLLPRFAKKLLIFVALFSGYASTAQVTYTVHPIPYNPFPYVGTANVGMADDAYSAVVPIGFSFEFYGNTYTDVVVGANGLISFNVNNALSYCSWPISASLPNVSANIQNSIMCTWQDLYPGVGGQVLSAQYGVSPNRMFVLTYHNVPMYSCSSNLFTGQIVLYESSNVIDIFTSAKQTCSWNGGYGILGIVNANGTDGLAAPGRDYPSVWTDSMAGWRFQFCTGTLTDTIQGRVYADINHNCTYDGNDFGIPNVPVTSSLGCGPSMTDTDGFYTMIVDVGSNNVSQVIMPGLLPYCPANNINTVVFTTQNQVQNNVDFADSLDNCSDVLMQIGSVGMRKCSTEVLTVTLQNLTPMPTNALTATITLPDSVYYMSSTITPTSVVGNIITYNLAALGTYGSMSFTITDSISCDLTLGSMQTYLADVDNLNDCDTNNNSATEVHPVVYSYDPNEVKVANDALYFVHGETIGATDTLTYQINFQNTGTSYAEDVAIVDTLPVTLDANSIVQMISSHNFTFQKIGSMLMWNFENIYLPDSNVDEPGSHGFVRFKVVQQPGNTPGTLIPNTAAIYFDTNLPVITNTATDTIGVLAVKTIAGKRGEMSLYPNPATDVVTVQCIKGNSDAVSVYNQLGTLVYSGPMNGDQQSISTKQWAKGMYLVRLSNKGQTVAAKLLVVN